MSLAERASAMATVAREREDEANARAAIKQAKNRMLDPEFAAFVDELRQRFGAEFWRYRGNGINYQQPRADWPRGSEALRDAVLARL